MPSGRIAAKAGCIPETGFARAILNKCFDLSLNLGRLSNRGVARGRNQEGVTSQGVLIALVPRQLCQQLEFASTEYHCHTFYPFIVIRIVIEH